MSSHKDLAKYFPKFGEKVKNIKAQENVRINRGPVKQKKEEK